VGAQLYNSRDFYIFSSIESSTLPDHSTTVEIFISFQEAMVITNDYHSTTVEISIFFQASKRKTGNIPLPQ